MARCWGRCNLPRRLSMRTRLWRAMSAPRWKRSSRAERGQPSDSVTSWPCSSAGIFAHTKWVKYFLPITRASCPCAGSCAALEESVKANEPAKPPKNHARPVKQRLRPCELRCGTVATAVPELAYLSSPQICAEEREIREYISRESTRKARIIDSSRRCRRSPDDGDLLLEVCF